MGFLQALQNYAFVQQALFAGLLAAVACGIVGTFVVTRRITYIAGSIAHCVLGGMGIAHYLVVVYGVSWLRPIHGALAAAILASITIGIVSFYAREREDSVIGAIWAIGMSVGILFIAMTPGYNVDLMSYLFGNILMVDTYDLGVIAVLDVFVLGIVLVFYRPLIAVVFDNEFARVRGVQVQFFYLLLLILTGLTVVIMVDIVGIVLVIALLTLPAAIAGAFMRTLGGTMVLAVILSAVFSTVGLTVSFAPEWPAGASIILVAGITYLFVTLGKRLLTSR